MQLLQGKLADTFFNIVAHEDGNAGVFFRDSDGNKLSLIVKVDGAWVFNRKRLPAETLVVDKTTNLSKEDFDKLVASWKAIPVYQLSKPILQALYSSKRGLDSLFGNRSAYTTRAGTFLLSDLLSLPGITKDVVKSLYEGGIFHRPK